MVADLAGRRKWWLNHLGLQLWCHPPQWGLLGGSSWPTASLRARRCRLYTLFFFTPAPAGCHSDSGSLVRQLTSGKLFSTACIHLSTQGYMLQLTSRSGVVSVQRAREQR